MEEIKEYVDIAYGTDGLHRFDAYIGPSDGDSLLICFIHGGAWRSEDKADFNALARQLATSTGGTVLVPNYRLTPREPTPGNTLHHPSHAEDVLLFLNYLLAWPGPVDLPLSRDGPPKLYLIGHSCSAHMLASIFLDTTSITPSLTPSPLIAESTKGIICSEGIYDIDLILASFPGYLDWFILNTFGRHVSYSDFSPVRHVLRESAQHIRWFIIHSKGDTLVDMPQSQGIYERLVNLYHNAQLPADQFVKKNMEVLVQEHNDIFVDDDYLKMITSFILG